MNGSGNVGLYAGKDPLTPLTSSVLASTTSQVNTRAYQPLKPVLQETVNSAVNTTASVPLVPGVGTIGLLFPGAASYAIATNSTKLTITYAAAGAPIVNEFLPETGAITTTGIVVGGPKAGDIVEITRGDNGKVYLATIASIVATQPVANANVGQTDEVANEAKIVVTLAKVDAARLYFTGGIAESDDADARLNDGDVSDWKLSAFKPVSSSDPAAYSDKFSKTVNFTQNDNMGADTRLRVLTTDFSSGYAELMWQPPLGK